VIVEARDLDTDERSRAICVVGRPSSSAEQRGQLAEAAARFHPRARMRSFADGAATFLDRQHLIVAFYVNAPTTPHTERDDVAAQERLFA
jgi:hypothetical protein